MVPAGAWSRAFMVKQMSDGQIKALQAADLLHARCLEAWEIGDRFPIPKHSVSDEREVSYWKAVAKSLFPEELVWQDGRYRRRDDIKAIVDEWAKKFDWVKNNLWHADVMACQHEFDWEVYHCVPVYSSGAKESDAKVGSYEVEA